MQHPSLDPQVMRRREGELAAARSAYEVGQLQERWQHEDQVAEQARDWRERELSDLRARVARIEQALGPDGKRLGGNIAAGFGKVLREMREHDRESILSEVEKRLQARPGMQYRGTWDEGDASYAVGSVVTHGGSMWVAIAPVTKGARPGKAAEWRMCVKGGEAGKVPGCA